MIRCAVLVVLVASRGRPAGALGHSGGGLGGGGFGSVLTGGVVLAVTAVSCGREEGPSHIGWPQPGTTITTTTAPTASQQNLRWAQFYFISTGTGTMGRVKMSPTTYSQSSGETARSSSPKTGHK